MIRLIKRKKAQKGQLDILCHKCGHRYETTFERFSKDKSCPNCLHKLVD